VAAVYGPGTNIPEAAREVLGLVRKVRVAAWGNSFWCTPINWATRWHVFNFLPQPSGAD